MFILSVLFTFLLGVGCVYALVCMTGELLNQKPLYPKMPLWHQKPNTLTSILALFLVLAVFSQWLELAFIFSYRKILIA